MLNGRELADRIDLTNGAKTCIFNPDGVFGIHKVEGKEGTVVDAADVLGIAKNSRTVAEKVREGCFGYIIRGLPAHPF
jgi:hypothetical protein